VIARLRRIAVEKGRYVVRRVEQVEREITSATAAEERQTSKQTPIVLMRLQVLRAE
jgi:hypothetical protein